VIDINEFSILMNLLSRRVNKYQIGAPKKEIMESLHLNLEKESYYFQDLLGQLSNYIEPLGLYIKYNPIDQHWFISHDIQTSNLLFTNPFEDKPKLAASLFCVLVCCLTNSGPSKIKDIKDLRKKKGILRDLKELEQMGYLNINKEKNEVILTPLIGYQLDLQKLFIKLSLKLKKNKKKEKD